MCLSGCSEEHQREPHLFGITRHIPQHAYFPMCNRYILRAGRSVQLVNETTIGAGNCHRFRIVIPKWILSLTTYVSEKNACLNGFIAAAITLRTENIIGQRILRFVEYYGRLAGI